MLRKYWNWFCKKGVKWLNLGAYYSPVLQKLFSKKT